MISLVDYLNLAVSMAMAVTALILLRDANGTRPFIVQNIGLAFIFLTSSAFGLFHRESNYLLTIRFSAGVFVLSCLWWAALKSKH